MGLLSQNSAPTRQDILRGLLQDEKSVAYRGGLLPYLARTVTDPIDDVSEYEQLEWAAPGLLYEPLSGMAKTGGMLAGNVPVDPRVMTQTMLDAPLIGGLLGATTGAAPRGAVLGAFSGGRRSPSEMSASELRAEANALRFPNENLNINAELAQSAKDYFGVTRSPNETGYIMQDGTRLDLSGRHYAGGYEKQGDRFVPEVGKPDYLGGDRAVDHRELYDLKGLKEGEHQWDAVEQLMRETGAVRYMPNQGISIIDGQKISDKQLKAIVSDFRKNGNSLTVDIDPVGGGSRAVSKTFDRPTVEGVREFIELGANKAPTAALPGLLGKVLDKRAQQMLLPPAERLQPSGQGVMDLSPEAYVRDTRQFSDDLMADIPRQVEGKTLPQGGPVASNCR